MALSAHLKHLQGKHARLDTEIAAELQRPVPDTLKLSDLKKEKLRLKEHMEQVQAA